MNSSRKSVGAVHSGFYARGPVRPSGVWPSWGRAAAYCACVLVPVALSWVFVAAFVWLLIKGIGLIEVIFSN